MKKFVIAQVSGRISTKGSEPIMGALHGIRKNFGALGVMQSVIGLTVAPKSDRFNFSTILNVGADEALIQSKEAYRSTSDMTSDHMDGHDITMIARMDDNWWLNGANALLRDGAKMIHGLAGSITNEVIAAKKETSFSFCLIPSTKNDSGVAAGSLYGVPMLVRANRVDMAKMAMCDTKRNRVLLGYNGRGEAGFVMANPDLERAIKGENSNPIMRFNDRTIIRGAMHEGHAIIAYKDLGGREDFVEAYDFNGVLSGTSSEIKPIGHALIAPGTKFAGITQAGHMARIFTNTGEVEYLPTKAETGLPDFSLYVRTPPRK